jgi:hypothetical protein
MKKVGSLYCPVLEQWSVRYLPNEAIALQDNNREMFSVPLGTIAL